MTKPTTRRALMAGAAATGVLAALPIPATAATRHEIEIRDFKFIPDTLTVKPGDTIRWRNRDRAPHDATAKDKSWKTKTLRPGKRADITVTAGMTTEYYCSIHPAMKASLTIVS
jgi:plastocyanin